MAYYSAILVSSQAESPPLDLFSGTSFVIPIMVILPQYYKNGKSMSKKQKTKTVELNRRLRQRVIKSSLFL